MTLIDSSKIWEQTFNEESLLHRITSKIKQSRELQEILAAAVAEVRSFLSMDRVLVYRFDADGSGEVIAESIHEQRLPSLLGLHFPSDDIPQGTRNMMLWAQQRSIVDLTSGIIQLSQLGSPEIDHSLVIENNTYTRKLDPCHIQYLTAMGVQSSITVPIIQHGFIEQSAQPQLWGLLVSHHSEPRTVLQRELGIVQLIVDQISLALHQSQLHTIFQTSQKREAIVNQVASLLAQTLPEIQWQAALEAMVAAFDGVGGRLYIESSGELYTWGDQPTISEFETAANIVIEQHPLWQSWMADSKKGYISAINDLYEQPRSQVLAPAFQSTQIRGVLAIPICDKEQFLGLLSIFRAGIDTTTLWAGGRERASEKQQSPLISFDIWLEQKKAQPQQWQAEEITMGQALAFQLSRAIGQQQMFQQLQLLNTNLEQLVQERTTQLQKSLELAQVMKQVKTQMRSHLDYKTTLRTIVREVRSLMKTDRVLIYKLEPGVGGEVLVEDVGPYWRSIEGLKMSMECFPDESARLYMQQRVRAINNTSSASLSPCHQEFLKSIQVKANVIVPININTQLWGLLIAHQCCTPRNWQDAEIDLLQQLADEAAIAIQQAMLYEKSQTAQATARVQAGQVAQVLHEMQQAQAQLVQTEKMSSFGLLALGVVQEINNSVNFICSRLSTADEHIQQLRKLLYTHASSEISTQAQALNLDFLCEDLPKIMSSMKVQAEHVRSTVRSLQNFSRLDQASVKRVNLHQSIDRALLILQRRLQPKVGGYEIEVIKDYGEIPPVECYVGPINQVFLTILNAAIHALTKQIRTVKSEVSLTKNQLEASQTALGVLENREDSNYLNLSQSLYIRISTGLSADGSRAVIRVAYNDPGMTQQMKERIFEPMFGTKAMGKEMELAISYHIIVQKHGGVFKCDSEVGQGTQLWIEIPLKQTVEYQ